MEDAAAAVAAVRLSPWGGVTVRTTLMVGFPGERESDFQELLRFVAEWGPEHLHHVGVFEFSPEEHAPAARFPDQVRGGR